MIPHGTHAMGYFCSYIVFYCHLPNFRMWFKYGLKVQKLLAQGIALGMMAISKTPCFTLIEQALSVFFNVNYI